jgi:hypothetical protein
MRILLENWLILPDVFNDGARIVIAIITEIEYNIKRTYVLFCWGQSPPENPSRRRFPHGMAEKT